MKLTSNAAPVQIVGAGTISNFSIAANGKAFRVLSDTLYSDKIGSIVREISCNAYDAHVMAGKKSVPFEVHIPDAFEPWFSVKDFGVGLSEEDIKNVFTVFFQSTKDASNDAIGCFGLGSKTPFSYTDQFTVTSVKNGTRSIYSAFIDATGLPSISMMHSEQSSEQNGVEIKVSVKKEDYHKFGTAVFSQLRFFAVKPVVLNNSSNLSFKEFNYAFENCNIRVGADRDYYHKIFIVQGNVGYPMDVSKIDGKISHTSRQLLDNFRSTHIELLFDIGEIGVTASREAIEYDEKTVQNIEKKLQAVIAELEQFLQSQLASKSVWEKAIMLNSNSLWMAIARASGIQLSGANIGNNVYFNLEKAVLGKGAVYFHANSVSKFRSAMSLSRHIAPDSSDSFLFIIRDAKTHAMRRINKIETENKFSSGCFQIWPNPDTDVAELKKSIQEALGDCKRIFLLSDVVLEKAERTKSASSRNPLPEYYEITSESGSNWTRRFDDIKNITKDVIYIRTEGLSPIDSAYGYFRLKSLTHGIVDMPMLIGVPKRHHEFAKSKSNFFTITEYQTLLKNKLANDPAIIRALKYHNLHSQIFASEYRAFLNPVLSQAVLHGMPESRIAKVLSIYEKVNSKLKPALVNLAQHLGISKKCCYNLGGSVLHLNIKAKYPLLVKFMNLVGYLDENDAKELVRYVKLVETAV